MDRFGPQPRATLARLALPWAKGTNLSGSKTTGCGSGVHSASTAHHPSFIVRRSSFIVHRSSFVVRRSSFSGLKGRFCQPRAKRVLRASPWVRGVQRCIGPEGAVHSFPPMFCGIIECESDSIPHIPFVPFDLVPSKQFPQFVLKRLLRMMFCLSANIGAYGLDV
jgi:hypothetical protein